MTAHVQNMGTKGQPVNQGRNHRAVLKQFCPAGERQVGGDNGAGTFTAVRDDLEQQFGFILVETHVTEFIQDQ